ncbi:TrmH family RNA methyltransferase [Aestuariimicrobium sp. T2.26MG-19.2B]|uniref:TrmH family RNA methyltransferase n=1 Tax=Aestuariimicrobium sp. T2.26MG-19.2B TaxID=3040679 RepID=UPI0024777EC2|nr:RNA methyltransferase [Aestuariimicrobium sp. T2.26MG-19.2B]CAI9398535.1 23S rRNA (uridine(2479)-2'-O)-methyltransferase [Aestuariimicrobium sp. T2.26MG-19.2B]
MTDDSFEPVAALPLVSKGQLRSARQLLQRRGRDESGRFLVEGTQAVREALKRPEIVEAVIVDDPARHAELLSMANPDLCWAATPSDIAQLADTVTSQGIFAICRQLESSWDDVPAPRLVVICSQVRDPGNAGTVIRCADAFGADLVVLTKGSVELHNPKTVRASVGSIFHLPVVTGVTLDEAVAHLRAHGMAVLAADGGGASLDQVEHSGGLSGPTAWILGNEAWGLPESDRALADHVVGVPMWGQAESLNLSTAAAVCLYATASAQRAALDEPGASS